VRQQLYEGRVNRRVRVEQMSELDASRLGHEPQQRRVAVECPDPTFLDQLELSFLAAIAKARVGSALLVLMRDFCAVVTVSLDRQHRDRLARLHSAQNRPDFDVFEFHVGVADVRYRGDRCA